MSADRLLAAACARFPDRPAVMFAGHTWTFREFSEASGRLAAMLQERGVAAGDLIGLLMPNRPEWLFWFVAISRIGGIAVPINPAYTPNEIRSILAFAGLRILVLDAQLASTLDAELLRQHLSDVLMVEGRGEDERTSSPRVGAPGAEVSACPASAAAVIYFSSGSTGTPKGVVHSRRNLELIVGAVRANWQLRSEDSILVAMPLAFVYASVVESLTAISAGATIILQDRFRAEEAVELIAGGEVTVIMGVPSMYRMLLTASGNVLRGQGRLRLCASGGDMISPALDRDFERVFGCPLFDLYGLTEVPHIVAHTPGRDPRSRPLSCGRPLRDVITRIVDEDGKELRCGEIGELVVRAPWMFLEYLRNRDATEAVLQDGWFRTGDLVRRDEDGYVYMVERKKELIKRSGFNILPGEVEEVIRQVPGVAEVAVIGIADELRGQRVKAFVVREMAGEVGTQDILDACSQRLAKYKIPEEIEFIAELPKGPTGKIMKKLLRG